MKIIIDISFEVYAEIKRTNGFKTYLEHAISRGVPLDTLLRVIDLEITQKESEAESEDI